MTGRFARTFSITVEITAPPARVWRVMADVERWPEWTPSVTAVDRLDGGPLRSGSRVRIRQPKLRPAIWCVAEFREGEGFDWETASPGVRAVARHHVVSAQGGARVTLAVEFSGPLAPLVARLTRGLNQRYLDLEAEGLRRRSMERG